MLQSQHTLPTHPLLPVEIDIDFYKTILFCLEEKAHFIDFLLL